jgi:Rha family phage regulatory protein
MATIIKLREINGAIYASSLDVARDFDKQHKDVLEALTKVRESLSENLRSIWFRDDAYFDARQRRLPCYDMTRQGFTLLVMGFTGKAAMDFKIAYILKFDEMEAKLGPGAKTTALFDRDKPSAQVVTFAPKHQQDLFDKLPAKPQAEKRCNNWYWEDERSGRTFNVKTVRDVNNAVTAVTIGPAGIPSQQSQDWYTCRHSDGVRALFTIHVQTPFLLICEVLGYYGLSGCWQIPPNELPPISPGKDERNQRFIDALCASGGSPNYDADEDDYRGVDGD